MTDSLPLAEDREEGAAIADKPTAPFVTIDGASTRDIDDAIRVEHIGSGYRIQVAISDPTKLVDIGSTEDENARLLGATVYFGDHPARRMLVARISEDEGSLVAGKSRPVFVMQIDLDETLEIKDFSVKHQRIKVDKRLTCEEIPVILQDVDHPLRPMLGTAAQLSGMLLAKRRRSGALAIYDLARLLISDEEGKLIATHRDQIVGQIIIQEFMVLANTEMAQYLVKHDIPGVFRNHEPKSMTAPADELAALIESWLQADGMNLEQVRDQFQSIAGRASYSSKVKGHFALATACYGHFTSPLRRYADLVNLRQVKAHLKKTSLPYTAAEIEPLAESLNATADKERETRSDGFKTVVIRTAERALQQNTLNRLADHELVQAMKLAKVAGYLPEQLNAELIRRLENAIVTDRISDSLMVDIPFEMLTDDLKSAFSKWISLDPARARHLLQHAEQTRFLKSFAITTAGEGTSFNASALQFSQTVGPSRPLVKGRASATLKFLQPSVWSAPS